MVVEVEQFDTQESLYGRGEEEIFTLLAFAQPRSTGDTHDNQFDILGEAPKNLAYAATYSLCGSGTQWTYLPPRCGFSHG
jgi:hypothetical protein